MPLKVFDLVCIKERAVNKIKNKDCVRLSRVLIKCFSFFAKFREIYLSLYFSTGAEECIMGANYMHTVGVE
jgi:hypothetical protein